RRDRAPHRRGAPPARRDGQLHRAHLRHGEQARTRERTLLTRVATDDPPREQAFVFGEVAEQYDAARPSYPDELYSTVIEYGGLRQVRADGRAHSHVADVVHELRMDAPARHALGSPDAPRRRAHAAAHRGRRRDRRPRWAAPGRLRHEAVSRDAALGPQAQLS